MKNRQYRRCKTCGIPIAYNNSFRWELDGIITSSKPPSIRFAMVPEWLLGILRERVLNLLGDETDTIYMIIFNRLVMSILESLYPLAFNTVLRLGLSRKKLYFSFAKAIAVHGTGRIEIRSYLKEDHLSFTHKNEIKSLKTDLFLTEMFKVVEKSNACLESDPAGFFKTIRVDNSKASTRTAGLKIRSEEPRLQKQQIGVSDYGRCGTCNAPRMLSTFHMNPESGIINEKITGDRYVFIPHITFNGFMRAGEELIDSFTEMICEIIEEVSCDKFLAADYPLNLSEAVRFASRLIRIAGWGLVQISEESVHNITLMVYYPLEISLITGLYMGIVRAINKSIPTATLTKMPSDKYILTISS